MQCVPLLPILALASACSRGWSWERGRRASSTKLRLIATSPCETEVLSNFFFTATMARRRGKAARRSAYLQGATEDLSCSSERIMRCPCLPPWSVTKKAASPSVDRAILQPPVRRSFSKLLIGIQRLLAAKCFVPIGVKMAGDGGLHLVERILQLIVFSFFLSGSLLQVCFIVLYFRLYFKVQSVNCIHRWYNECIFGVLRGPSPF
jgi:hypothetical protein